MEEGNSRFQKVEIELGMLAPLMTNSKQMLLDCQMDWKKSFVKKSCGGELQELMIDIRATQHLLKSFSIYSP